jgi:hypothetical protein
VNIYILTVADGLLEGPTEYSQEELDMVAFYVTDITKTFLPAQLN